MNRFRVGLHVPGNVAMACKKCNNEKRRDDQQPVLSVSDDGWESFLSHDGSRCSPECKTCGYWKGLWPESASRVAFLADAKGKVRRFQEPYSPFIVWSGKNRDTIRRKVEKLYRDGQTFATEEIEKLTSEVGPEFSKLSGTSRDSSSGTSI
jgi:hypothetical protein